MRKGGMEGGSGGGRRGEDNFRQVEVHFGHTHPYFFSHLLPDPSPSLHSQLQLFLFFFKRPICAVHISVGVATSTGTWSAYQRSPALKKTFSPSPRSCQLSIVPQSGVDIERGGEGLKLVRHCEVGMVAHACNPSIHGAKAGRPL